MWHVEDKFRVIIGGNTYINIPNIVVYKGESLFTLKRREKDGQLGIDFDIFDKKGHRIATMRGNRIVQGNEDDYEMIRELDRYAVVEKSSGRVICDIRRRAEAPHSELEVSVELYTKDGFLFKANPEETNIGGITLRGNVFSDLNAGIVIE
jgi:hypothetical protein